MPYIGVCISEKQRPGNGQQCYYEHPCKLCRRIHIAVEKVQHHHDRKYSVYRIKEMQIPCEKYEHHRNNSYLQEQQQSNDQESAEYNSEDAFFVRSRQYYDTLVFTSCHIIFSIFSVFTVIVIAHLTYLLRTGNQFFAMRSLQILVDFCRSL